MSTESDPMVIWMTWMALTTSASSRAPCNQNPILLSSPVAHRGLEADDTFVSREFALSIFVWPYELIISGLNLTGAVWTVDQETHHTVTVEFYDRELHRDFHFTDPYQYDKACLSEFAAATLVTSLTNDSNPQTRTEPSSQTAPRMALLRSSTVLMKHGRPEPIGELNYPKEREYEVRVIEKRCVSLTANIS